MDHAPATPRPKPLVVAASAAALALLGLVAAPTLVLSEAWLVLGRSASWSADQGDGFAATLYALGAAPFGAVYGALWGALVALAPEPASRRRRAWIGLAGFVLLAAGALELLMLARVR